MTGQARYKEFVNDYISPAMRTRGFKGSGGSYKLPDAENYILVGLQKNKWNSQEVVEFTVNLSVINRALWEAARKADGDWIGKIPSANSMYANVKTWHERLGNLRIFPVDRWWKIDSKTDLNALSSDIFKRLDHEGMKAIKKQLR